MTRNRPPLPDEPAAKQVLKLNIATPLMTVGGEFSHGGEVLWANDGSGLVDKVDRSS